MIGKLIENWLDNATERSYQPVFVQLLTAQGYQVVHSTRHNVLEFGKDVLAVSPEREGCAYQLKSGSHGQRLGLSEFRSDIQPQLVQLLTQPVVFPGFPKGPHHSFLVSNGFFDEEVQRAADDLNRNGFPSTLRLISRGELLAWCKQFGEHLWPAELSDAKTLMEMCFADPRDVLPVKKLAPLLYGALRMLPAHERFKKKAELQRALSSAALLVGIAAGRFAESENHYAVAQAWTLYSVTAIAAIEKHGHKVDKAVTKTLALARDAIQDALYSLWKDVRSRGDDHLIEGDWLTDQEVFPWRYAVLLGSLSCLAIRDAQAPFLTDSERQELTAWLQRRRYRVQIWGESAVSLLVPWIVWRQRTEPTRFPDADSLAMARMVVTRNQRQSATPLPNPYYSYEDFLNVRLGISFEEKDIFLRETFAGASFTAELLFHMLARSNQKTECKFLWADFSRISHRRFVEDHPWQYCILDNDHGIEETRDYPRQYEWSQLKADALAEGSTLPKALTDESWLLGMWWQVAPHRLTTEATRAFIAKVFPQWGR